MARENVVFSPQVAAPERPRAGEATRGSAVKLGTDIVSRGFGLATTLVIARELQVAGFGTFAAVSGAALLAAQVADLGLQTLAVQALVTRTASLRSLLRAKLVLTAALAAATAAAAAAGLPLFAVLVAYWVLVAWVELFGAALRARGRRLEEAVVLLCLRGAGLAAVLALPGPATPLAVGVVLAASTLAPFGAAAGLLRRAAEPGVARRVGEILRLAFPLGVNGGLAQLSLRVELLALEALRAARDAGLYGAALRIVEGLTLIPGAVSGGAMPSLVREGQHGHGPVRERTATTAAVLGVPAAVGLALVGPRLLELLFGPEFAGAGRPLQVFAAALPAMFLNAVLLHALVAAGRAPWLPRLTAVRVAAAALLAALLIPRFGAAGGAAGFAAAELVLLSCAAHACRRARFPVPVVRPLVLGLGLSGPMALAVISFQGGPLVALAAGVLAFGATVAAALWAFPGLLQGGADVRRA